MSKGQGPARIKARIILLIMDLDGTFLYGDRQPEIIEYCNTCGIKYGFMTRRSYQHCRYPVNVARLYQPHFIACAAGTELWLKIESGDYRQDTKYELFMSDRWPGKETVEKKLSAFAGVSIQANNDELRVACYLKNPETLDLLNAKLASLPVRLETAGFPLLDILPLRGGKEGSLRYLAGLYACPLSRVISCGGNEADYGLLMQPHHGIVVANCDNRLYEQIKDEPGIYFAQQAGSAGVYEGLQYWGAEED